MRVSVLRLPLVVITLALAGCGSEGASAGSPPPVAAEALREAAGGGAAGAFYEKNGWQAAWTPESADTLRDALASRSRHGLDRAPLGVLPPEAAGAAERDAGLTKLALAYAGALATGAADPTKLYEVYTVARPKVDVAQGLQQALQQGKLKDWLDGLAPQDDRYKALSEAYLRFREEAGGDKQPDIAPVEKPIAMGESNPRVPQIVARLVESGYLARPVAGARYTPAIANGVKQLQADFGVNPDGLIGGDTLAVLNMSAADRARTVAVAMERQRWLARTPPATRIDVNLATATLQFYRDGALVDERKVVVGDPETETPQLQSPMFRLAANPTWTVPRSIQEKELAPKGDAYLSKNNMKWEDGWIVQQPGPENSLGLVKFDMQNEHAIYLHDTPAKTLFDKNQRQLSHGCVRVYDALGFATMLAEMEGVTAEWEQARATGEETFVKLPRQIPVRLLYDTAIVDANGAVVVRTDPYGWNDAVAQKIGFRAGTQARFRSEGSDVGP